MTQLKVCNRCGWERSALEFYLRSKAKGSREAVCKQCRNEQRAQSEAKKRNRAEQETNWLALQQVAWDKKQIELREKHGAGHRD